MNDQLAIYQLNVQSADKLDERRDATTRAHGGICIVVTTAAVSILGHSIHISAVLWGLLLIVAFGWLATLDSLTAKLTAKNRKLAEMERKQHVPTMFLRQERKEWKRLRSGRLQMALKRAPWAFVVFGAGGLIGTLVPIVHAMICT